MKRIFFLVLLVLLVACQEETPPEPPASKAQTCRDCHPFEIDPPHDLGCTRCHRGQEPAPDQAQAHQGLISTPADAEHLPETCLPCHKKETQAFLKTEHYTLAGEINTVRGLFGLAPVATALELPEPKRITNQEDLVNDLLRRRCLRCHVFYRGDDYAETQHGLGCAACHLPFSQGALQTHVFQGPGDQECLHCHYGNRVGWDYYGLAEHDYPYAFRSPLINGEPPPRPWGIEFHELRPDVHLQAGMSCLACHGKDELMFGQQGPRCLSCHHLDRKAPYHAPQVLVKARCSACHARWSFWDEGLYLVLHEAPDWEEWSELMVQGSSEVENALVSFLTGKEPEATMLDKFSWETRPGIWLLTLKRRRFEEVHLGWDAQGRLAVLRPLGDLHLSYVNQEDEAVFDEVTPAQGRLLPYAPHTIGAADYARTQEVLRKLRCSP